jgi:GNAT superfamily N-acetyltransferase
MRRLSALARAREREGRRRLVLDGGDACRRVGGVVTAGAAADGGATGGAVVGTGLVSDCVGQSTSLSGSRGTAGPRNGWLAHLYVEPEWTGRGLGSRLVNLAKELHPNGLDLWTFQSNVGARHFYERHGFAALETTDGANEEGAPDVHYHWHSR